MILFTAGGICTQCFSSWQAMVHKDTLHNNLTVITERMPYVRSVAFGLWIKVGSMHEKEDQNGMAHFIEHMLFKGTQKRDTLQIAREVDTIGGQMDAFTSREYICLNLHVLDEHFERALEIMADMVLHPRFHKDDLIKERGVILEEIKMVQDTPDELAQDLFVSSLWKGHPLGRPIAGIRRTVQKINQKALIAFFRRHFRAGNMIFTAAGNLHHEKVLSLADKYLGALKKGNSRNTETLPRCNRRMVLKNNRKLQQLNICLGIPAYGQNHRDRYACHLLNAILGGTMSSRLLQKIREELGLAYSIFSFVVSHKNSGFLLVHAGTGKKTGNQVIDLIAAEMTKFKNAPVSLEELNLVKDFVKGVIFLGLESTPGRMAYLAKQEMYHGSYQTPDSLRKHIDAVTREDVLRVSTDLFSSDFLNLIVVGDLSYFRKPASISLG